MPFDVVQREDNYPDRINGDAELGDADGFGCECVGKFIVERALPEERSLVFPVHKDKNNGCQGHADRGKVC